MVYVSFEHAFRLPWGAYEISNEDFATIYNGASWPTRDQIEHWLLTDKGWAMKERARGKAQIS